MAIYMKNAWKIIAVLLVMHMIQACQVHNIDHTDNDTNLSSGKELVLKGRISLPLPEQYEKVLLDEHSIIITAPEYSIVYRWIDKEEIEFIGSKNSPYTFFKNAFTNPASEEEKRFLEGLKSTVQRFDYSSTDLEFFYFDSEDGQQVYILSQILDFVVEITYKGEGATYIDSIIVNSEVR
ncbi:hypothetical protein [Nitrincola iocasae]|uniref:Lipoprotein n=1 Tax=Nitrincola iocasae TaxID=2614693 RepID=A0A5J6LAS3_9GAMM|nr:hypothetical protein [Nitrincola iocasae]QEW05719.1 hypothetical protein F5I99_04020 [Nitrincola iocasae]